MEPGHKPEGGERQAAMWRSHTVSEDTRADQAAADHGALHDNKEAI